MVFIEEAAITEKQGASEFYIHHPGSAFNTLNPDGKTPLKVIMRKNGMKAFPSALKKGFNTTTIGNLIARCEKPLFYYD